MAAGSGVSQNRQTTENNVVEIDLLALLLFSLKRWRVLIVLAIVFALLFGGVEAFKMRDALSGSADASKSISESTEKTDPETEYENSKDVMEKQLASANQSLAEKKDYMESSILYNLDSSKVNRVKLTYNVKTQNEGDGQFGFSHTSSVVSAYLNDIDSGNFYSDIDSKTEAKYLRELVKAYNSKASDNALLDNDGVFTVSIVGKDEKQAEKIASAIKNEIDASKEKIEKDVYPHDIVLISERKYVTDDNTELDTNDIDVAANQYYVNQKVYQITALITNIEAQMKNLSEPESDEAADSKSLAMHQITKYAVIGLLIGIIIFFCFYAALYALSGKVYDTKKFSSSFRNVNLLGNYFSPTKKGSLAFDRFLAGLDGRRRGEDDFENVMKLSSANFVNTLSSHSAKGKLLITGTCDEKTIDSFEQTLKSYIDSEEIDFIDSISKVKNIIADFEGSKALADADFVVLLEAKDSSKISDIRAEIKEINRIDKVLAGIVLV